MSNVSALASHKAASGGINIPYDAEQARHLSPFALDVLRYAIQHTLGAGRVRLVPTPTALVPERLRLPDVHALSTWPKSENYVHAILAREFLGFDPDELDGVLFLDIETHGADLRWDMEPREFFRLGQYAWGTGPIITTTSFDRVIHEINAAKLVVAHNGHSFDFSVLLGDRALDLTLEGKLFDTMVHANMVFPAPESYTDREGRTWHNANAPSRALKWLGLDNLCYQLSTGGKEGNITELAKRYNPPKTKRTVLDYARIPTSDPDFLAYARQDIEALRGLYVTELLARPITAYDLREQVNAAIDAQNGRNGFRVDAELARGVVRHQRERKEKLLAELHTAYGFPTSGAMPWRTKPGKQAIFDILKTHGITPESHPEWPTTATGNLSLSGDALVALTQGTEEEDFGRDLAELMGQRSLAELTLDSLHKDGKVHMDITSLQRSGRKSSTHPSLPIYDPPNKRYFVPDNVGERLVSIDLSSSDARAVAAFSGDTNFAKRFEPGVDAHELTGRLVFGDEVYDSDPKRYRKIAKRCTHAWDYGASENKIALAAGIPVEQAHQFVVKMATAYPKVLAWQDKLREEAKLSGGVTNRWGRFMPVDEGREYTQAPALIGQSATREVVVDALIKLAKTRPGLVRRIKAQIHDELIVSLPVETLDQDADYIVECLGQTIGGVEFIAERGEGALNWEAATH